MLVLLATAPVIPRCWRALLSVPPDSVLPVPEVGCVAGFPALVLENVGMVSVVRVSPVPALVYVDSAIPSASGSSDGVCVPQFVCVG